LSQSRSRQKLVAVLLFGALLLAAPFLWGAFVDFESKEGRTQVYSEDSPRSIKDLAACLLKREQGGPALEVVSRNHFSDPVRGLTVTIDDRGDRRTVRAWLPPKSVLGRAEADRLASCRTEAVCTGAGC
jgi:hypothetical protein